MLDASGPSGVVSTAQASQSLKQPRDEVDGAGMSRSAHTRRRSVRKPHRIQAMVEQAGSCSLANIVSFAREGVGLATDIHSLPRRFDRVRVKFDGDRGEILLTGDVCWATPRPDMSSAYGVQLHDPGEDYTAFYDSLPL